MKLKHSRNDLTNSNFINFMHKQKFIMKNAFYFTCILCLFSCTRNSTVSSDKIIDKFPLVSTLQATELKIPPILLAPSNMCIVDSFMIVSQSRPDTIFSIFKLPNCQYLLSFGNQGRGPEEFNLSMEFLTLNTVYGKNGSFAVGNLLTKIQYYKINDIINRVFKPYKIARIPPKLNRFRAITYVGDSLIFGAPYGGNMHIFKFNTFTNKLESYEDYPMNFPQMISEAKREVFACFMASKPDNSKFLVAYYTQGVIEINNLTNNNPIKIIYKGFPSLMENDGLNKTSKFLDMKPDIQMFCERIIATNKYIYVRVANEAYSKIYNADGIKRSFIREIHVFDWSGKPIIKLKFDKFFSYFALDEFNKNLYTIDDSVSNKIMRYDLSKVLPKLD